MSVVLPTRDRPDDVVVALRSVLSQTHRRLEVLVVDDASVVPVDEVVERVARGDRRVEVLRLCESRGAAGSRNVALSKATGEFVAFLDDDDVWEPDKLASQLELVQARPEVGIVSCDYLVVGGPQSTPLRFRGPGSFTAAQVQWMNLPGSFSFVMARRSLLGDELNVDESFPSVEDWDLWLRCVRRAPAAVVRRPLVRHRVHGGLSQPHSERLGLEVFIRKHEASVPPECLAFLRAHSKMLTGDGWSHRRAVASSMFCRSAAVSGLLVAEQVARQFGVLRQDPGIVARAISRLVSPEGRILGRTGR